MKYKVRLIETTQHEVEVECSTLDNPEQIACRLWREGLAVDSAPELINLQPYLIERVLPDPTNN